MNWTNYFIALGLPVILVLATFIVAEIFHKSEFLTKVFLWCCLSGLVFIFIWIVLGIVVAVMGAIGD